MSKSELILLNEKCRPIKNENGSYSLYASLPPNEWQWDGVKQAFICPLGFKWNIDCGYGALIIPNNICGLDKSIKSRFITAGKTDEWCLYVDSYHKMSYNQSKRSWCNNITLRADPYNLHSFSGLLACGHEQEIDFFNKCDPIEIATMIITKVESIDFDIVNKFD